MWRSRCRSASRSRIWACTVTSSPVVGSSARTSRGAQARAMAIITRWRMPPDSWNGYQRTRSLGGGDADRAEQLDGGGVGLLSVHVDVEAEGLGDLPADPLDRVEGGHRVLEDHAQLGTPDLRGAASGVRAVSSWPAKCTVPAGDDVAGREQAHDRPGQHGLARTRLADDAQGPAAVDGEGDPVHGAHRAPAGPERRVQVVHHQQGLRGSADVGELERGAVLRRASPVHSRPSRMSKRWRSRSPMRLMDSSRRNMESDRPQHDVGVDAQLAVGRPLGDDVPPRRGGEGHRQPEEGQGSLDDDDPGHRDEAEGDGHRHHVGQDLAEDDARRSGSEGAGRDHELAVGERRGSRPAPPGRAGGSPPPTR